MNVYCILQSNTQRLVATFKTIEGAYAFRERLMEGCPKELYTIVKERVLS